MLNTMYEGPRRAKDFGVYKTFETKKNVLSTVVRGILPTATVLTYEVNGIDISKWNYPMDFSITSPKVNFLYARAGYGFYRDPNYIEYRNKCKEFGTPLGAYWYTYVGLDIDTQVNSFVNVLNEGDWVLYPVIDIETSSLNSYDSSGWVKEFMSRIQAKVSKPVMIYTSPGWWNSHISRNTWAANYPLWVAHWTSADSPVCPYDWSKALFWQWSADGNRLGPTYGSGGDADMDLDRFMGTSQEWLDLLGGFTPPPAPDKDHYSSLFDYLSSRTGPYTSFTKVNNLMKDESVEVLDYEVWIKYIKNGREVWSAVRHLGKEYMVKDI